MTSDVSALSGIVAKGHQAMLTFSPPPLKFRTAGFPQYGFKRVCPWRPSPAPQTYTPFKWKSGLHVLIPGIRPGHMSVLAPTHSPNGPWLPRGLYCPPGFSLTMAISEPLHASRQFNVYIRLALRSCASLQRVPNLLCQSFCCVPSSVLRWPQQVLVTMSSLPVLSSPNSNGLDSHACPRQSRSTEDVLSKLQCSLTATARTHRLPCSGQDFYFRAFAGRVAPVPTSDMTRWFHRHLPSPVIRRLN